MRRDGGVADEGHPLLFLIRRRGVVHETTALAGYGPICATIGHLVTAPQSRSRSSTPSRKPSLTYLGLPAHSYKLVDWLVRLTKPQDWGEGSRPIAWPDARRQAEFLGVSPRDVQMLNRVLQEAGVFVMHDDPQGRRYGYRDPKTGRIAKAFGFDLSLLMERHEEFKKIAAEAEIERTRMKARSNETPGFHA